MPPAHRPARPPGRRTARARTLGIVVLLAASLVGVATPPAPARAAAPARHHAYPSAARVRAARRRAASAAAEVARLQRSYQAAAARLDRLQGEVADAADAYAAAAAALAARTADATAAHARAVAADQAAAGSRTRLGQYAAAMYESGGTLGRFGALLGSGDPRAYADTAAGLDAFGQQWSNEVATARTSAGIAAEAARTAHRAEQEQQQAADAARAAEVAAQARVAAAASAAQQLQRTQRATVARLARLRHTSQVLEQRRQDGIAAARARAAARAAALASRAQARSGGLAILVSGGGPSLTRAQLNPKAVARALMPAYGFGSSQWGCLDSLWNGESGWRWSARNPSSGAYGIPQSLPASKMAAAGSDWLVNPTTQIRWGLAYIRGAYGSPCRAWSAWLSRSPHWY